MVCTNGVKIVSKFSFLFRILSKSNISSGFAFASMTRKIKICSKGVWIVVRLVGSIACHPSRQPLGFCFNVNVWSAHFWHVKHLLGLVSWTPRFHIMVITTRHLHVIQKVFSPLPTAWLGPGVCSGLLWWDSCPYHGIPAKKHWPFSGSWHFVGGVDLAKADCR